MKKTLITLGLITAVGIAGIFVGYKINSFPTTTSNSYSDVQSPGINDNNPNYYYNSGSNSNSNYNNNTVSNNNSNYYNNNADSYSSGAQDSMGVNLPNYIYNNGQLEEYSESKASQDGSITISTDQFKEGDKIDIKVGDSM